MKTFRVFAALGVLLIGVSAVPAAEISGEYLEARTCDTFTGACFANGDIGLAGKEAVMAWKVDKGKWKGVKLDGLSVVLVLNASDTLGFGGTFKVSPAPIKSLILVDQNANEQQRAALVAFVKDSAKKLTKDVAAVKPVPIKMKNDFVDAIGSLNAGGIAKINTRAYVDEDCICTHEEVFYPPLAKVDNIQPAFAKQLSYRGKGLNSRFNTLGQRSAFLATFSK